MKSKKITVAFVAILMVLTFALGACGRAAIGNPNAVGATLDGKEISIGFLNFMAKYQQSMYDSYSQMFGDDMWSQDMGSGVTMEDSVKAQIISQIEDLYLLDLNKADYGVEISAEDVAAMETAAQGFLDQNSDRAINQMGATKEYIVEMLRLFTVQTRMQRGINEEVDREVSDEEAAQRTFSFILISKLTGTDEEGASFNLTEEDQAQLPEKVAGILAEARVDFDAAAEDSGYTVQTYTYGADEETLDPAVVAAADALQEGEVSDIVETDAGYYILRLDSAFDREATDAQKEEIIGQREADRYNEVLEGYREAADFVLNEDEWTKVRFDRMFNVVFPEATAPEE